MAKRDPVKEMFDSVCRAANEPEAEASGVVFREALRKGHSIPAARAAQAIGEARLADFAPDLEAAFSRFMKQLPRSDKGCKAKVAILEALDQLDCDVEAMAFVALRHVQMEGTYGPPEDTAGALRGRAAAALVRMRHPDALREVAALLFDPWHEARLGAVRAAGYHGGDAGELLLRMKIHGGDEEPSVLGDCFSALLQIAPEASLKLVASFLHGDDEALFELAALALGESRRDDALAALADAFGAIPDESRKRMLLLPAALTRCEEAVSFLLRVVREESPALADAALEAAETCGYAPSELAALQDAHGG